MPEDHRENDKIILEEIRDLQKDISKIDINLALNTQETTRLAKYQELQNNRVGKLESRTQILEGATAISTTALAKIQSDEVKREEHRSATQSRVFWAIIGTIVSGVLFLLGRIVTYFIQSDAIKQIIK